MRIVQIGHYPEDENIIKGGTQSSIFGLVTELVRKNHEVSVISLPDRGCKNDYHKNKDGLRIKYFANKAPFNILSALRFPAVTKEIKALKPEMCHLHGADLLVFLIYIYCRIKKISVLVTVHGLAYIEKKNDFHKHRTIKNFLKYLLQSLFEVFLLNLLNHVIVDTDYVADSFKRLKKKGILLNLPVIHIIPQGINERFYTLPDNYDRNKILSVGSMSERKGHLYLIKSLETIIRDFPGIKLDIIGNKSDRAYYKMLNEYISANSLNKNIEIHTGLIFEELLTYYMNCYLFVLHSEEESQGIVFCEAMACGKPVVATKAGGIPDVIIEGKGGCLSSYADITTFSTNIKKILSDGEVRREYGSFNRTHSKQYSWSTVTNQLVDIYQDMALQKNSKK